MKSKKNIGLISIVSFIISIFFLSFVVYADTNGVWHDPSDVRGGTFGTDEMDVTDFYTFIHPVVFEANVTYKDTVTIENTLEVKTITSSDSSGNVIIKLG